jgi:hypothetical protein
MAANGEIPQKFRVLLGIYAEKILQKFRMLQKFR